MLRRSALSSRPKGCAQHDAGWTYVSYFRDGTLAVRKFGVAASRFPIGMEDMSRGNPARSTAASRPKRPRFQVTPSIASGPMAARSFSRARASIWRTRSRVSPMSWPISSSVFAGWPRVP